MSKTSRSDGTINLPLRLLVGYAAALLASAISLQAAHQDFSCNQRGARPSAHQRRGRSPGGGLRDRIHLFVDHWNLAALCYQHRTAAGTWSVAIDFPGTKPRFIRASQQ